MQKKQTILVVASLLVVVLSVSLAWFTAQIIGKGKNLNVSSANLQIVFTDSDGAISGSNIEPGWSDTKTFTIKNDTKTEYKYNIVIKDLLNTFVTNGYLKYKITSTNDGYNMTEFKDVPKSSAPKDTILAYSVSIPVGVTQSYTIEFKYANDESVDQSDDMGKKLSGRLFITEVTEEPVTLLSQILNDNPTRSERTDFSTPFTTNTVNTLYKSKEDNTDVYYFAGVDSIDAHCEVEGITGDLLKFINGYSTDVSLSDTEAIDEETCKTKSLCNLNDMDVVLFDVTQAQCQEFAENNMGWYDESMYSEDLTNRTWVTELNKPINNWVKFANLYWRIIRTNHDSSIRLLYVGTSPDTTTGNIGESTFNTSRNSPKYVGYMYGNDDSSLLNARTNTNNSAIKKFIDSWYQNNLTNYTKYLSTSAVYCNDRSEGTGQTYNYASSPSSQFNFAPYYRMDYDTDGAAANPSYNCSDIRDAFSVENTSAKLDYPVSLMTADEIVFAGGGAFKTINTLHAWFISNSVGTQVSTNWWSLSPAYWNGTSAEVWEWASNIVNLSTYYAYHAYAVRPVISLKSCTLYSTGNGTYETPYEIVETSNGC